MLSLWSSATQRLGVCTNRLIQASKSVSSPLLTGTRTSHFSSLSTQRPHSRISQQHLPSFTKCLNGFLLPSKTCPGLVSSARSGASFEYMHRTGLYKKVRRKERHPLEGNPQLKGVVLKVLVKKPKKPNSANRKCVRLRLTNGKEVTAYVPGEGHNLQEHNVVLVEGGRLQDTPGVKLTCVRGKYDLPHVKKRVN